jgi:hypothetical protein
MVEFATKSMPVETPPAAAAIHHGVRSNLVQILFLVAANGFVGAMIGVERTVVPLLGREFGLVSNVAITSFIISFGVTKAFTNLLAGRFADWIGRRTVLIFGWLIGIQVPVLVMYALDWKWVVFANALLGVGGFAAGINKTIGYGCVALVAFAATEVAARYGLRPYPFYIALAAGVLGLFLAVVLLRETQGNVEKEQLEMTNGEATPSWGEIFARVTFRDRSLFAAPRPGSYHVRLKFAETQYDAPRQRAMTIHINGRKVVEGFDVFATAGEANKAVDLVYSTIPPGTEQSIFDLWEMPSRVARVKRWCRRWK